MFPEYLTSFFLILEVVVRVFTEKFNVLPRVLHFAEVPVFVIFLFVMIILAVKYRRVNRTGFEKYVYLFIVLCVFSTVVNAHRAFWPTVLLFVFGFAHPIFFFLFICNYHLKNRSLYRIIKIFVILGVAQLPAFLLINLPEFIPTRNPDFITGTFGNNAYQFVVFLQFWSIFVVTFYLLKLRADGKKRWVILAGVFQLVTFGLFLLAQYGAAFPFYLITLAVLFYLSPLKRRAKSAVLVFSLVGVLAGFQLINLFLPELKWAEGLSLFEKPPPVAKVGKLQAGFYIVRMMSETPHYVFTGTGPGTFSSRAWRTFAVAEGKGNWTDVQGEYVKSFMGGRTFSTDVADKYVLPLYDFSEALLGGTQISSPFSSYYALVAEVGLPGLILVLLIYVQAVRISYQAYRFFWLRRDFVMSAAAFACYGGFLFVMQLATIENWLESARTVIPLWTVFAVVFLRFRRAQTEPSPPSRYPAGRKRIDKRLDVARQIRRVKQLQPLES
jgi:hypothetical protein